MKEDPKRYYVQECLNTSTMRKVDDTCDCDRYNDSNSNRDIDIDNGILTMLIEVMITIPKSP